jgi:hypothetical protein
MVIDYCMAFWHWWLTKGTCWGINWSVMWGIGMRWWIFALDFGRVAYSLDRENPKIQRSKQDPI